MQPQAAPQEPKKHQPPRRSILDGLQAKNDAKESNDRVDAVRAGFEKRDQEAAIRIRQGMINGSIQELIGNVFESIPLREPLLPKEEIWEDVLADAAYGIARFEEKSPEVVLEELKAMKGLREQLDLVMETAYMNRWEAIEEAVRELYDVANSRESIGEAIDDAKNVAHNEGLSEEWVQVQLELLNKKLTEEYEDEDNLRRILSQRLFPADIEKVDRIFGKENLRVLMHRIQEIVPIMSGTGEITLEAWKKLAANKLKEKLLEAPRLVEKLGMRVEGLQRARAGREELRQTKESLLRASRIFLVSQEQIKGEFFETLELLGDNTGEETWAKLMRTLESLDPGRIRREAYEAFSDWGMEIDTSSADMDHPYHDWEKVTRTSPIETELAPLPPIDLGNYLGAATEASYKEKWGKIEGTIRELKTAQSLTEIEEAMDFAQELAKEEGIDEGWVQTQLGPLNEQLINAYEAEPNLKKILSERLDPRDLEGLNAILDTDNLRILMHEIEKIYPLMSKLDSDVLEAWKAFVKNKVKEKLLGSLDSVEEKTKIASALQREKDLARQERKDHAALADLTGPAKQEFLEERGEKKETLKQANAALRKSSRIFTVVPDQVKEEFMGILQLLGDNTGEQVWEELMTDVRARNEKWEKSRKGYQLKQSIKYPYIGWETVKRRGPIEKELEGRFR